MTTEPGRIARLEKDKHGRPVPWFVAYIDGEPDFRVIKPGAVQLALARKLCWICGVPFERQGFRAFTIGPMCAVNRNSAEPPGHPECAAYSATHCPFLVTPRMVRRDRHLPAGTVEPAGVFLTRNPGVALVWVTRYNSGWYAHNRAGGTLFDIGPPSWVEWYAEGRTATRAEVLASIESGMPALIEAAGPAERDAVEQMKADALLLVPGP